MKKICTATLLALGILALFNSQSKAATHRIFSSLTYYTSCPEIAEKITLVNGEGVVWDDRLHTYLYYMDRFVLGDFDGDGRKDAAVIIGESQAATGGDVELAFLIYDGKQFVHQQSIYLGNRAIINSLRQRAGKVVVDMFVHQQGDCQAGPTKRVIATYDFLDPPSDELAFPRPILSE